MVTAMMPEAISRETRPLGEQERLLNYLHAFGGLIALQVLHVRGPVTADEMRRALAWLQSQHPILRAHIRYGGLVFRDLPPFAYRQPWFDTEGTTEIPLEIVTDPNPGRWRDVLAHNLRTPLRRGKAPRIRVTLVRESADADLTHIVICADHATIDAQSGNLISRQLLEYFADPVAAEAREPVHATLPPPLESRLPKKSDSGTRGYQPALRLPKQRVTDPKSETRILSRRLSPDITAALKAAIKQHRTTLHGCLTAAFLTALRERQGVSEMTVLTTIDLRRLCRPALPAETYGCYIDILRTRHEIGDNFWATAREASFKLITTLAKDQESASIMKLPGWDVYRAETGPTLSHNRRIDGLAVTTAGESGLRRHYGAFELEDVTMAVSLDMFGPSLFVIASEREGGVDLSVGYTAYAMDSAEVEALTDRSLGASRNPRAQPHRAHPLAARRQRVGKARAAAPTASVPSPLQGRGQAQLRTSWSVSAARVRGAAPVKIATRSPPLSSPKTKRAARRPPHVLRAGLRRARALALGPRLAALALIDDRGLLGAGEMPAGIACLRWPSGRAPSGFGPCPRCGMRGFGAVISFCLISPVHRQRAADQPLDVAQLAALGAVAQRDGDARGAVARRCGRCGARSSRRRRAVRS